MADRTVRVRVVADTSGFAGAMRGAAADAERLGTTATGAGRGVRGLGEEGTRARTGLSGLGTGARGAGDGLTDAEGGATRLRTGLRGLTGESGRTVGGLGRIGAVGGRAFGAAESGAHRMFESVKGLGELLAAEKIGEGIADIVREGNDYTNSLNKFQEVTRASGLVMNSASREAQALGADLRLPEANASEAADAMVELAKAGLSAGDSIQAARGTIQLASAARTDVATAARIEGDSLDQFSLKASDATMVADTLANVSNNTSGELTDLAYALKYVGPVAHGLDISIQQTATTIGLLGKSGIIGETAGTALRSMLVNISKPTDSVRKGLHELGIEAYDSAGHFKGMEYVVGKLSDAQKTLTNQQFTAAAAMAFGKPALSAAVALAHQGTQNFDAMALAVGRQGGAAALAAAESKGLGGAMKSLGKELDSTFLQVYTGISPALEKVARGAASGVFDALPYIKRGIQDAEDLWDIYGPEVEAKLSHASGGIEHALTGFLPSAEHAVAGLAEDALPLLVTGAQETEHTFRNAAAGAKPFIGGMEDLFRSVSGTSGAFGTLDGRIQIGMKALGDSTSVLKPVGGAVGGLAHDFAQLPGPIQLSVLSMVAMRPFRGQIRGLQDTVTGYGRAGISAFRGIGDASLYQRVLAAGAGQELGRFGGYVAALESRSPAIARMGSAFRTATADIPAEATAMQRFGGTLRGVSAATAVGAMSGLKGAAKGVMGVMGGPWGLALTGAFTLMDVFAQHQQAAKQAVEDFTGSIEKDTGALGGNTAAMASQKLQSSGALATAGRYGISLGLVTQAALGNKTAQQQVTAQLQRSASTMVVANRAQLESGKTTRQYNSDAQDLLDTIGDTSSAVSQAKKSYDDQAAATAGATSPTQQLNTLIDVLGNTESDATTRTQALQQALNLMSGGALDVQAAVAQQTQAIGELDDTLKQTIDHSKGWGHALVEADGSLNTTTANGAALNQQFMNISQATGNAAEAVYQQTKTLHGVRAASDAAAGAMERQWREAVKAGMAYGLNRAEAEKMAAQMQMIPSTVDITVAAKDLGKTAAGLLYVQGLAGHLPKGATVTVSALSDQAVKDLRAVGVEVEKLPGGRQMRITVPDAEAQAKLNAIIAKKIPDKTIHLDAATATARAQLQDVENRVGNLKGKTLRVDTLSADAIRALRAVGFEVTRLPNKQLKITVPTGGPLANVNAIQLGIDNLHGKDVTNTVTTKNVTVGSSAGSGRHYQANGGLMSFYADGGTREQHVAQIARGGDWRVWAEPETQGEAYIPLAANKRGRSTAILDEVARRFGYRLEKYAAGGITAYASGGFTYSPTDPTVTLGPDAGMDRYNSAVDKVNTAGKTLAAALTAASKAADATKAAEENLTRVRREHHTASQLAAAEERLTKARKAENAADAKVKTDRKALNSADASLGVKAGTKSIGAFSLSAYEKQLAAANKANSKWEANLDSIGKRAGADVEDTLRGMGTDGEALVAALAKATGKQFSQIVGQLKQLAPTAKATLRDYTKQLSDATSTDATFQANLLKLSGMGDTALATQLAGQGDAAAEAIAAQAVKSPADAAKANTAAKGNANLLTGDDLTNAMTILSTLQKSPGAGFAQLVAAGLDVGTIEALLPKIMKQVQSLPPKDSSVLLSQLAQVQSGKGLSFARGGIAPDGAGLVHWAERGTGGEAYIPLAISNRARSTGILSAVAGTFGYQLTPVGGRAGAGADGATHVTHHRTVHLHGAKQTSAEQAADIVRHMAVAI